MDQKNIYQRMLGVMGDLDSVAKAETARVKTKAGGEYSYRFVSHDAVAAALHPLFVKHGIYPHFSVKSAVFNGDTTLTVLARFVNADSPDDVIETEGVGIGQGDKGPGIAYSYAVKTILLKSLLLESGEPDSEHQNPSGERPAHVRADSAGDSKPQMPEPMFKALDSMLRGLDETLRDVPLTDWEQEFLADFMKKFRQFGHGTYVSDKQEASLVKIYDKVKCHFRSKDDPAGIGGGGQGHARAAEEAPASSTTPSGDHTSDPDEDDLPF